MHRIHYAGNSLVTGSSIAHALLAYAQVLAAHSDSATVTIPIMHPDGSVANAEILIGPASQLVAETYETADPELEDPDVVDSLTSAASRLTGGPAVPEETADYSAIDATDLELPASPLGN
jgi:hypothetical protein